MIQAESLTKAFDHFLAVDRVSLEVKPGEVLALLGPNGAGKTTTLRMLTSVLRPTSGRATVAGFDTVTQAVSVRSSVGILTEQQGLYGRMSADEYLDFFGQIYHMPPDRRNQRVDELLEQFSLQEDRKRRIGEYSKGMRQKLALARALLHDPPALLLDEPTSAMDPESARLVRNTILALKSENRAIIVCTHNLSEAEELAGKIAIIQRGRIIIADEVQQLKTRLLGAPQFEIRLGSSRETWKDLLPEGANLVAQGPDWFRYQASDPAGDNPHLVQNLVEQHIPVIELSEVPRSLETVYLNSIDAAGTGGNKASALEDSPQGGKPGHVG